MRIFVKPWLLALKKCLQIFVTIVWLLTACNLHVLLVELKHRIQIQNRSTRWMGLACTHTSGNSFQGTTDCDPESFPFPNSMGGGTWFVATLAPAGSKDFKIKENQFWYGHNVVHETVSWVKSGVKKKHFSDPVGSRLFLSDPKLFTGSRDVLYICKHLNNNNNTYYELLVYWYRYLFYFGCYLTVGNSCKVNIKHFVG